MTETKRLKHNLEKQERVVEAVWELARRQQTEEHNCRADDGTSVNLSAVGNAIDTILAVFGYERVEIQ